MPRIALCAVLAVLGVVVAPPATAEGRVHALLADGSVLEVPRERGRAATLADVSRGAIRRTGSGPFLVRTGSRLLAAVPGRPSRIVALDLLARRSREVQALRPGLTPRALLRGAGTGRLYLVANEAGGGGVQRLVVQALTPDGTAVLAERVVKPSAGTVFSAAMSSDGQRLAVAYHGDAGGFDLVDPATLALTCASPTSGGCVSGHGSVHFAGDRLFTSTGTSAFDELLGSGATRRRDSRLRGNHLLEFATRGPLLYATGACGYTGGLARMDLRSGAIRVLVRARPRGPVCGSRLVAHGRRLLLAAGRRLLVLDARSGAIRRSIGMPAPVVDIAAGS